MEHLPINQPWLNQKYHHKEPRIFVLHGPNLNLLGFREPEIYGQITLDLINQNLFKQGQDKGFLVESFQENSEGALIDHIHKAQKNQVAGLIINAAGYTHTSVALRDALLAVSLPTIEVHLSNIYRRESFRHHSLLAPVCIGCIIGFGPTSYYLALHGLIDHILQARSSI